MQRELKFRVWDNLLKEMSLFLKIENGEHLMHFSCINFDKNRFEIMQFTGLKDSDGKEIYEGDIIENYNATEIKPLVVIFSPPSFNVSIKPDFFPGWPINPTGFWKILGNIYENPELLKDK